jgi:diguanylate cyclase (GGDEF)-like protein
VNDKSHYIWREDLFDYLAELEVRRAIRYQNYAAVILMEADQGSRDDGKLDKLGQIVREEVRVTDIVGRINHTRFGIILLHADPEGAHVPSDRILSRVKEYFHAGSNGFMISMGGACCPNHGTDKETLISRAEAMLAQARAAGGNISYFPERKEEL